MALVTGLTWGRLHRVRPLPGHFPPPGAPLQPAVTLSFTLRVPVPTPLCAVGVPGSLSCREGPGYRFWVPDLGGGRLPGRSLWSGKPASRQGLSSPVPFRRHSPPCPVEL